MSMTKFPIASSLAGLVRLDDPEDIRSAMVPRKSGRQQGPGDVEEQPEGYAIRKTSTAGLIVMYIEGRFSDERGRRACGDWKRRGRRNEEDIGLDIGALESSGAGTDGGRVLPVPAGRSGRYPIGWARVEGERLGNRRGGRCRR